MAVQRTCGSTGLAYERGQRGLDAEASIDRKRAHLLVDVELLFHLPAQAGNRVSSDGQAPRRQFGWVDDDALDPEAGKLIVRGDDTGVAGHRTADPQDLRASNRARSSRVADRGKGRLGDCPGWSSPHRIVGPLELVRSRSSDRQRSRLEW